MSRPLRRSAYAAAALLLTACAGPVSLPDPEPAPEVRAVCSAVMGQLPRTIMKQPRRAVRPGVLTAAWGNPAITVTCGGAAPSAMVTDTRCFEVDGVGWYAEEGQGGWLFTTHGRRATVQLGVPSKYAPEAGALTEVAPAINANDPVVTPCV